MNCVELFCGSKSFGKVASSLGFSVFSVDIDPSFNPSLCIDILDLKRSDLPKKIDVLWASPPCVTFSVCSISKYWVNGVPKNKECERGILIVLKTLSLIEEVLKDNPNCVWFVENPVGMLRKQAFMKPFRRVTITYCRYGFDYMKPTDIWTNLRGWSGRRCFNNDLCHFRQPRGYFRKKELGVLDKGVQGLGSSFERGFVPSALFFELFSFISRGVGVVSVKYLKDFL